MKAPERWADLDENAPDAQLGKLLRGVREPEPLSALALARIRERLELGRPGTARRRLREVSMATVMLLAGSSFALAGWGASEWWGARSQRGLTQIARPVTSARAIAPRPRAASPARVAFPAAEPSTAESAAPMPAPTPRSSASSRAADGASTLQAETHALEQVLRKLRREHDAQGALTLLDESRELFARGSLALEADVARVDALLALSRKTEALALLERLPFAQIGRGGELRLVRAELRRERDCGRALADFDVLVTQPLPGPLAERALYGRAACELEVGDREHAERDLSQYLARFPQGRFAPEVRARLGRLQGP